MRKFKTAFIELYKANVWYIKCSRQYFLKLVKREFNKDIPHRDGSYKATYAVYEYKGTPVHVIWLSEKASIGDLVHECFHLTHSVLQNRGLCLVDNSSEEAYAYFLQHVFDMTKGITQVKGI
jgi:hypothetical protein